MSCSAAEASGATVATVCEVWRDYRDERAHRRTRLATAHDNARVSATLSLLPSSGASALSTLVCMMVLLTVGRARAPSGPHRAERTSYMSHTPSTPCVRSRALFV